MVRYKVLATLIISALILLGRPASALTRPSNLIYEGGLMPGREFWVRSLINNKDNTGCDSNTTTINAGQEVTSTVFYSTNSCQSGQELKSTKGDIVVYNFSISSRGFNDQQFIFNFGPINDNITEFTILSVDSLSSSSAIGSQQYQLTVRYNVDGAWLGFRGRNNYSWLYSVLLSSESPSSLWITWHSIVWYTEAGQVDSDEANDYYEQQNQGNTNIEGQDTSGDNQGVSDSDYSSLLDVFSGFITAITNVSGGTCTISLNTDFANLGNVDLCTYDPPSYIQVIGSIILILLFVPLSMALIKRILKTIQELQQ